MFFIALRIVVFASATLLCMGVSMAKSNLYDMRDSAQDKELRRHLTYLERPVYPTSAQIHRKTGTGLFWMKFDKTGRVTAVKIIESTKQPDLDNAAVYAFYHWRSRPGEVDQVIVPITFTFDGWRSDIGGHH